MKPKIVVIIPARLESERLPRKMLLQIAGKSILEHVYTRAIKAKAVDAVYIATNSSEIKEHAANFCDKVIMTSSDHISGTSRISEAITKIDADYAINVQGDEVLIEHELIDFVAKSINEKTSTITACYETTNLDIANSPNTAKIVLDNAENAMYFSRSPIPFFRDNAEKKYLIHFGIYGYSREFLLNFKNLAISSYATAESLEQINWLYNNVKLRVVKFRTASSLAIDTQADFDLATKIITKGSTENQ